MNRLVFGMVLIALVFAVSAVPAAATEVYFVPDLVDATSGETFFVEMWLNSTEGVTAFQAEIYFNSTVVNITDVKSGDYSNSFMWNNIGDYIRVLGQSGDVEDYPPGSYLLANFTLVANNSGASPLHYTDWCLLCNASCHEVGATWKDGTVRIDTSNFPPSTPSKPSGPAYGINGTSYTFSTSATDPDGDLIKYGWDWNGDGTVDEWTNLMASGTTDIRSHSWEGGIYNITVKARDEHGAESAWSSVHMVHINSPPSTPSKPSGPTSCSINKTCYYSTSATDPDGDLIKYGWDWNGDGTVDEWTNLKAFGTTIQAHSWTEEGTYNVKVKAKDEYGEESAWSNSLTVNVTLNIPPVAVAESVHRYNNVGDVYPCKALFDASASYDPDGYIINYTWDFGDGYFGEGQTVGHVYSSYKWNGTGYEPFNVSLTVKDEWGLTNTTSLQVNVYIAGDANGDGVVDIFDGVLVGLKWDYTCTSGRWESERADRADLNNDCIVDIFDAVIVGANWEHTAW